MENHIKNLFLNYAAHLSINCEFINENKVLKSKINHFKLKTQPPIAFQGTTVTVPYKNRFSTYLYKQDYIANCLASLFLVVDKLIKNHAKILLVNGEVNKLQVYLRGNKNHKASPWAGAGMGEKRLLSNNLRFKGKPKNIGYNKSEACYNNMPLPSVLQGGWVNGACSNWSRLRKIAWNSHKLIKLTGTVYRDPSLRAGSMESWVSEAESIFRGLQSKPSFQPGPEKNNPSDSESWVKQSFLAYKHKPDCIFLINPSLAVVRECKSLNVPLCIVSSSTRFKVAASYLESNQESCFLTYLILNLILR